ncbi:hypothetical protein GCM10022227_13220 [Streptomyces sedi]
MIETSEAECAGDPPTGATLPVPPGVGRALVLAAVFVCAACGLVYELELIALADYLAGDTVTLTSLVLSSMVFAMGIGSLGAKRLRQRASVNFALVEALLALVGGCSATVLHLCFLWTGEIRPALILFSLTIGLLIGAEMPLLMTLIQRIRRQDAGRAVADLSAADYVGALLGGLAFPFLLLPLLGHLNAALFTGVVNALAGGAVVLWLFRGDLGRATLGRLTLVVLGVTAVLLCCTLAVDSLGERAERLLRQRTEEQVATVRGETPAARGAFGPTSNICADQWVGSAPWSTRSTSRTPPLSS